MMKERCENKIKLKLVADFKRIVIYILNQIAFATYGILCSKNANIKLRSLRRFDSALSVVVFQLVEGPSLINFDKKCNNLQLQNGK